MNTFSKQFFASQQATIDNVLAVQGSFLSSFEKLVDINLKAIKASFDEVSEQSKEVLKLQDPQDAITFSSRVFQPNTEKAVAYGKDIYDVLSGIQVDVTKLTEAQLKQFKKQVEDAIEQLSKNAPAGSEGAIALLKSSLDSANSAYDTVAKSARQAAEVAESNFNAATDATVKAARDAATTSAKAAGKAK